MKRILSIVLAISLMMCTPVFAEENTDKFTVQISGDTIFSTDSVNTDNINTLSSVATVSVTKDCDYYTVHSSDTSTKIYKTGESLIEIGAEDKVTSETIYVHTEEPGKMSLYFTAYSGESAIDGEQIDLECKVIDTRDKVELKNITIGGMVIDGFESGKYSYVVDITNMKQDTTIGYTADASDRVETIVDGNKTYLIVFNKDNTKSTVYDIELTYSVIDSLDIEINTSAEVGVPFTYQCKYNNGDINNIVNVEIDNTKGFVVKPGEIKFVDSGSININFTIGSVNISKTVDVTGEKIIDVPQHQLTVGNINKAYTGEVYNVKYSSSVFPSDTRIVTTSSQEEVIAVLGNKIVALSPGTSEIKVEHPILGEILKKEIIVSDSKTSCYEIIPEIESINIKVGETKTVDFKLSDVYIRNADISIDSGSSIKLLGGKIVGLKKGKSTIKISSGSAERVVDVNVVTIDTIIPTEVSIENKSSDFVVGKESTFEVTVKPEGATLDASDIAIKSDKKIVLTHKNDLIYSIKPIDSGKHTITVTVSRYSMENSILIEAKESGEVVNPDVPGTKVDVEKIVLEDTYISLEVGDTKTIKVKNITPASATNKEVRYESMNTRYATIDKNGRVTGERAGTVKINVYSVSNPEVYATCTINVYDEDDRDDRDDKYRYPVDKVVIYREDNGKEVAIRNGKTDVMVSTEQQFVARIYPYNATNQEVRWYTSNSNIAEVDEDGMLTAYRVGEVELRVVTRDGNHRDSIKVEITEWMLKPTSIKIVNIDNSEVNTEVKTGDKLALKVNFEPLLTTERDVIWTITEGFHLFTLSKTGDVEFKEVGRATIKVYTKDYSTYTTLTFNITYSDGYWKDIGSTKNMSPRKAIEVKFSEALSISNIQNGNIFVATTRDGNTKAENVVMELVDGNRVLRVSSLSGEWEPEKTYYLLIKGASKSESGIQLIKNCRYTFETRKGRQSAK